MEPPNIEILNPEDDAYLKHDPTVIWRANGTGSSLMNTSIHIQYPNGTWKNETVNIGNRSFVLENLPKGEHSVIILIEDRFRNATDSILFTIDKTAPAYCWSCMLQAPGVTQEGGKYFIGRSGKRKEVLKERT